MHCKRLCITVASNTDAERKSVTTGNRLRFYPKFPKVSAEHYTVYTVVLREVLSIQKVQHGIIGKAEKTCSLVCMRSL